MDRLKRRNELDCIEIVREFHDYELASAEPDESFLANCKRLIAFIQARHEREDAEHGEAI
jgi:hypothetical protein